MANFWDTLQECFSNKVFHLPIEPSKVDTPY